MQPTLIMLYDYTGAGKSTTAEYLQKKLYSISQNVMLIRTADFGGFKWKRFPRIILMMK